MRRLVMVLVAVAVLAGVACAEPLFKGAEKTPGDAIVLFDGTSFSEWVKCGTSDAPAWKLENGYMEVVPGTGYLCTKRQFTDFQLHIEFWLPLMADAKGQARANSGVYLQGRFEIQVLDSYGLKPEYNDCGAAYGAAAPMVNACRQPEQWQTYDIVYHAPKFDDKGVQTSKPRATVFQNGVLIHYNTEWPQAGPGSVGDEKTPGPIMLQDHGNKIRYRNVWIRPL